MTKDEALHKALKVLNCLNNDRVYETAWVKGAINACEEALEQPAQEPVATVVDFDCDERYTNSDVIDIELPIGTKLYTHPHQWQGLSDSELEDLKYEYNHGCNAYSIEDIINIACSWLKEKNTNHINKE